MRIFGVALVTAALTASCGSGQSVTDQNGVSGAPSRVEEFPEPPDSFERLGLGLRPAPIQWIRTTGDRGDRILYYEDVVDSYGEQREITVTGVLTITENSATQEKSYRWQEVHRKIDIQNKSSSTIKTDQGSGTVATELATTAKYGPVTVYRLNGTRPADKFRTWVTFGRELVVPVRLCGDPGVEQRNDRRYKKQQFERIAADTGSGEPNNHPDHEFARKMACSGCLTDDPLAQIVQCGELPPTIRNINDLQRRPIVTLELPTAQRGSFRAYAIS